MSDDSATRHTCGAADEHLWERFHGATRGGGAMGSGSVLVRKEDLQAVLLCLYKGDEKEAHAAIARRGLLASASVHISSATGRIWALVNRQALWTLLQDHAKV